MDVYEATPDGVRLGGVIVIPEAYGVNDYIRRVVRDLADEGYHAVAPDVFHRVGISEVPYGDVQKAIEVIGAMRDDEALEDVDAALLLLRASELDDHDIGVVGFCMGGRLSFLVALERALGAAVGFYGGGIVSSRGPTRPALIERVTELRAPWLGLFGDDDRSIPIDDVETLRDGLRAASVETDVVRYAGAGHGFHCDHRADYAPHAAADAWRRTISWLERHLAPPGN
jgi:carboxymethylenebutenolidase